MSDVTLDGPNMETLTSERVSKCLAKAFQFNRISNLCAFDIVTKLQAK